MGPGFDRTVPSAYSWLTIDLFGEQGPQQSVPVQNRPRCAGVSRQASLECFQRGRTTASLLLLHQFLQCCCRPGTEPAAHVRRPSDQGLGRGCREDERRSARHAGRTPHLPMSFSSATAAAATVLHHGMLRLSLTCELSLYRRSAHQTTLTAPAAQGAVTKSVNVADLPMML